MKIFGKTATVIMLGLFFVCLCLLLYPSISQYWNEKVQTRAVADYNQQLATMTERDYTKQTVDANKSNCVLKKVDYHLLDCRQVGGYDEVLNIGGDGIMGYISIDKIGVELPIYHGISDEVLTVAAGHIEGTSLPVGGVGTHCALSAHRGLPNAKLFTHLDKLEVGDTFVLNTLGETLTYQVDQVKVVTPEAVDDLLAVEDKDYCTLVTCTPYGINSHRLLVRGERVATQEKSALYVTAEAYVVDRMLVTLLVALPILFVLILVVLLKPAKAKNPYRVSSIT